jgi:hypothetical protein
MLRRFFHIYRNDEMIDHSFIYYIKNVLLPLELKLLKSLVIQHSLFKRFKNPLVATKKHYHLQVGQTLQWIIRSFQKKNAVRLKDVEKTQTNGLECTEEIS